MNPPGKLPSGARSKVVERWIGGVTAPAFGSTGEPAWTARVSICIRKPQGESQDERSVSVRDVAHETCRAAPRAHRALRRVAAAVHPRPRPGAGTGPRAWR